MNEKYKNEKLITVCVYADTTGLYSESECNRDNISYLLFPEKTVIEYFNECLADGVEEDIYDYGKTPEGMNLFKFWYEEMSTADDTIDLYSYARKRGWTPIFGVDRHDAVFYRDDCNFKYIVFEGTYDECRYFGKNMGWKYNGNELEILGDS